MPKKAAKNVVVEFDDDPDIALEGGDSDEPSEKDFKPSKEVEIDVENDPIFQLEQPPKLQFDTLRLETRDNGPFQGDPTVTAVFKIFHKILTTSPDSENLKSLQDAAARKVRSNRKKQSESKKKQFSYQAPPRPETTFSDTYVSIAAMGKARPSTEKQKISSSSEYRPLAQLLGSEYVSKGGRVYLDIPAAAVRAGFSLRHFRRIIEDERMRIMQIGRKFFLLGRDFERWQCSQKTKLNL